MKEATEKRKRMQAILSAAFVLMLALAACGPVNSTEEPPAQTAKEQAPPEDPQKEQEQPQEVVVEKVQSVYMPFYGVFGTATLEEMIAHATIIVRATFDPVNGGEIMYRRGGVER